MGNGARAARGGVARSSPHNYTAPSTSSSASTSGAAPFTTTGQQGAHSADGSPHAPRANSPNATRYASTAQQARVHALASQIVDKPVEHGYAVSTSGKTSLHEQGAAPTAGQDHTVAYTASQWRQMSGGDFVHNHPGNGGSLSDEDVMIANRYNVGMHAVTRGADGVARMYSLRTAPTTDRGVISNREFKMQTIIDRSWAQHSAEARSAIAAGRMTQAEAVAGIQHAVLTDLTNAMPNDVFYSWDVLPGV